MILEIDGTLHKYIHIYKRMITFIKAKLKKSYDQTNIRVAANITEYHIISKLIFQRIIIPKFIMIWQLFHLKKMMYKIFKKLNMFSRTFWSKFYSF